MNRNLKLNLLYCALLLAFTLSGYQTSAQTSDRKVLSDIAESSIPLKGERYTFAKHYRTLHIDKPAMKKLLDQSPAESNASNRNSSVIFEMPMPDGSTSNFRIVETQVMDPILAAKYPDIKTYCGQGIADASATIRLDMTPHGFHAMVLSSKGSYFIDPYSKGNTDDYICYEKGELINNRSFICEADDEADRLNSLLPASTQGQKTSGAQLRTYRLALAATGEYTTFHGGTVALALAAQVTTMNRVDGVYERELAIRMVLVANNNLLIYTNAATDPYTNFNGSTMLGENQTNCNAVIGSANYDIGHVFSTGGGGIAGLGVVCSATNKARGVTGLSSPIGDGFDIDYVAHEMGHQFGANHSFNSITSACNGNRNAAHAFEPGSGITIMAYAGICSTDDLAPHSIAYFNIGSFDEIVTFSTTGNGNTCPVNTASGNNAPVVTDMGQPTSIPISTPFILTGSASDVDGDPLTYSWEEYDLGPAGAWNVQSTTAPMFMPFSPVTSPSRTFPKITDIINNTTTVGELLPNQARTLKFILMARDNKMGGGGAMHPDTTLNISVVNNGGPFAVTVPNTAVTYAGSSVQTVTWNVNGTDIAPINCANVKISLSTDGGFTFPTVILASTPNDGSESITVPNIATTTARIKVEAADNIFFDMSNVNFTITPSLAVITTSAISPLNYCPGNAVSVSYTIDANALAGNTFTAQLSDASGSFASPVNIGILSSVSAGTIAATIPNTAAAGTGYRIRVVSSNPAVTGSDNGADITIFAIPAPSISGTLSFCTGSSTTLNAGLYSSYLWSTSETTQTISVNTAGTFTVTVTNAGGCTGSASITTTILPSPTVSVTPASTSTCQGNSVVFTAAGSGIGPVVLYAEGFNASTTVYPNNYSPLPSGWSQFNQSVSLGTIGWFTGDAGVFPPHGGSSYIACNFQGTTGTGTISDWLFMPNVTLNNGDVLTFWTRTTTGQFPDRLQVRMSTNGNSTNTGSGAFGVGDFTNLLLDINPTYTSSGYPITWTLKTATVSGLSGPTSGRLAFRYFVESGGPSGANSDYIGVDDVTYNGNPVSYVWSGGTVLSPNQMSTNTAGIYTVTFTDVNTCTASATAQLTVNPLPTPVIIPNGPTTFCQGDSVSLSTIQTANTAFMNSYYSGGTQVDCHCPNGYVAVGYTGRTGSWMDKIQLACRKLNSNGTLDPAVVYTSALGGDGGGPNGPYLLTGNNVMVSGNIDDGCCGYLSSFTGYGQSVSYILANGNNSSSPVSAGAMGPSGYYLGSLFAPNGNVVVGISGWLNGYVSGISLIYAPISQFINTYQWSNGSTDNSITVNTTGNYTVTVTDANGCSGSASQLVTVNPKPVVISSSSDTICSGSSTTLSVTGASGYIWTPATGLNQSTGASVVASPTTSTVYTITATDPGACSTTIAVIVKPVPTPTISGATSFCANSSTTLDAGLFSSNIWTSGSLTFVKTTGGQTDNITANTHLTRGTSGPLYNAVTQASAITNCSSNPDNTEWAYGNIANWATLTYQNLFDLNACTPPNMVNNPMVLHLKAENIYLQLTFTSWQSGGGGNFTYTRTTYGLTPYPSYSWSTGATTQTINVNTSGTYTVTVVSPNGCTASTSVSTTANPLPAPTISGSNAFCAGGSTTIDAGAGYSSYQWSTGSTNQTIAVSAAGIYTVTVTNSFGCSGSASISITQSLPLSITNVVTDVLCKGNNTGSIVLTLINGQGPFSYIWSDGATTKDRYNLYAGPYTVTVTDNCTSITQTFKINEPATGMLFTVPKTSPKCFGGSNGSASVTISGGVAPFSYLWSNGKTTSSIVSLSAGIYTCTVSDASGCTRSVIVIITAPSALIANATKVNPTGSLSNGSATVAPTGGTPPYAYLWNTVPSKTTATITGLGAGVYNCKITDKNGCTLNTTVTLVASRLVSTAEQEVSLAVNPNPNDGNFVLNINACCDTKASIELFDNTSRLLFSKSLLITNGDNQQAIRLSNFAKGMYYLKYNDGIKFKTIKVVIE